MNAFASSFTAVALGAATVMLVVPASATAQTVQARSSSSVSYLTGAPAAVPLYNFNNTGVSTLAQISSNTNQGVQNAFSSAALESGALKVLAGGTANSINAGANAWFGDSFGAVNTQSGAPFTWGAGDAVSFNFAVTGEFQQSLSAPAMLAIDGAFTRTAFFNFRAWRPGYFDLSVRMDELFAMPFTPAVLAEMNRLAAEMRALEITGANHITHFGRQYSEWFDGSTVPYVDVQPGVPTAISVQFQPGGSFEWMAQLDVSARFQPATTLATRPTLLADFSHTLGVTFQGPAGSITTSGSGLFPGTIPVAAIPEPGTWALMLAGVAGLFGAARRRA